jgi:hypothetical protein
VLEIEGSMTELNESAAKRIGKLIRLMSSEHDGEWGNAVRKLKLVLGNEGLTFNDLATVIENCDGEIEERKYSDIDAKIIFDRGVEKGRAEEAQKQAAPPEFYDADGEPRWYEIAVFCQQNSSKLRDKWEQDFANDIPAKILKYSEPTERQKPHLLGIFVKLGGRYVPKK